MKRPILALVLGACPTVLFLGGTAGAATHGGTTQSLTINRDVTLAPGGLTFTATGTYTCPVGNSFNGEVIISQRSGGLVATGTGGYNQLPCTGTPQTWQAQGFVPPFTPNGGAPLKNGKASAFVSANSFDPTFTILTSAQFSTTVTLGH